MEQRFAAMKVAEHEAAERKAAEEAMRAQFQHPGQLKKHVLKLVSVNWQLNPVQRN